MKLKKKEKKKAMIMITIAMMLLNCAFIPGQILCFIFHFFIAQIGLNVRNQ